MTATWYLPLIQKFLQGVGWNSEKGLWYRCPGPCGPWRAEQRTLAVTMTPQERPQRLHRECEDPPSRERPRLTADGAGGGQSSSVMSGPRETHTVCAVTVSVEATSGRWDQMTRGSGSGPPRQKASVSCPPSQGVRPREAGGNPVPTHDPTSERVMLSPQASPLPGSGLCDGPGPRAGMAWTSEF